LGLAADCKYSFDECQTATAWSEKNLKGGKTDIPPGTAKSTAFTPKSIFIKGACVVSLYSNSGCEGDPVNVISSEQNDLTLFYSLKTSIRCIQNTAVDVGSKTRVVLYDDVGGKGASLPLSSDQTNLEFREFNDKTSAVTVPSSYAAVLYFDANFEGPYLVKTENDLDLTDDLIVPLDIIPKLGGARVSPSYFWSDKASSVEILPNFNEVVLYIDEGFQGSSLIVKEDIANLEEHQFSFALWDIPFNDKVSSIYIPPGYKVIIYDDKNYNGKEKTISSSVSGLTKIKDNTDRNWNDRFSSIKVIRR
jgi:hypothetical protein